MRMAGERIRHRIVEPGEASDRCEIDLSAPLPCRARKALDNPRALGSFESSQGMAGRRSVRVDPSDSSGGLEETGAPHFLRKGTARRRRTG